MLVIEREYFAESFDPHTPHNSTIFREFLTALVDATTDRYVFGKLSARILKRRPFWYRTLLLQLVCGEGEHGKSAQGCATGTSFHLAGRNLLYLRKKCRRPPSGINHEFGSASGPRLDLVHQSSNAMPYLSLIHI